MIFIFYGLNRLLDPKVVIEWKTESEIDTLGFYISRQNLSKEPTREQITQQIILAEGSPIIGSTYEYIDKNVNPGNAYLYELQEVQLNNDVIVLQSIEVEVAYQGLYEIGIGILLGLLAIIINIQSKK